MFVYLRESADRENVLVREGNSERRDFPDHLIVGSPLIIGSSPQFGDSLSNRFSCETKEETH